MSARDDLAALVSEVFIANSAHPRYPEQIADAILAAGWQSPAKVQQLVTDLFNTAAQVQRVRDRCAFWADAGDAEADIATDILTAIISDPSDDEEFCPVCFAGMESSEHREKCEEAP